MNMKKTKSVLVLSLSCLVLLSLFFGQVSGGHAQEGDDWSAPVNLSLSGLAADPQLLIDFQGNLHVIWKDESVGYMYSQSADDGATWTYPRIASFPFNEKGAAPTIFGDPTGAIHIFWIGTDGALNYSQTTPAKIIDSAQWQTNRRLASSVLEYDVILDSRNALQLTYIHNASGLTNPAGIYYMRTAPGGAGWSDAINLYASEYFRSTTASEAFLRIAASNTAPVQSIYVTWDNRSQKRVFMAASVDGGVTWGEAQQVKGPQDTGGIGSPFNLNAAASGDKVLLVWQIGEPGSGKCSVSSQWSVDAGKTWGEITALPGGSTDCPESSQFLPSGEGPVVLRLSGRNDSTLMAWDGSQWSDPQAQTRLPTISNPLTFDTILLGCRFDLIRQDRLYVVGCDEGGGSDAWFLSRDLPPVEAWFSPQEAWSAPVLIAGDSARITSLVSVADSQGVLHSVWAQSGEAADGSTVNALEYVQWNDEGWTRPDGVITGLDSPPSQIALAVDNQEKLFTTWVDERRGELLFSWVNLGRATLASEWAKVVGLPSPSNLIASPDMVVDGSGRIVLVFAIPLNEERGIYIVQSTDSGQNWSAPVRVFDAVAAQWDEVDDPEIGLTLDGTLHIIFHRTSARSDESMGVFYTRSQDGGGSWSPPQTMSEGDVQWSEIIAYDRQTVHVLWQEYDGLVFANLSQISRDGGAAWSRPFSITGVNDNPTPVTAAVDTSGTIHFLQLLKAGGTISMKQDDLTLQDWVWDGSSWTFASDRNLSIRGEGLDYDLAGGVTSRGHLVASVSAEYSDLENHLQEEILAFNRYLGETAIPSEAPQVIIPTPAVLVTPTQVVIIEPTMSVDPQVLFDDNTSTTATQRNLVGMGIIGVALIVTALLLIRGRPGTAKK